MANFLILFTIVILDPYKWIRYENPTLYMIDAPDKTVQVYEGNQCIQRYGCYDGDGGSNKRKSKVIYVPMPMQGSFSFDDLFEQ